MMPPKCYTWLESCGSQLSDGKNEKLFFCILQSVGFSRTLRTDIFLYTEKLSYLFKCVLNVLQSEETYNLIGCISLAFSHCAFSSASSSFLFDTVHTCNGCICLCVSKCALKFLGPDMQNDILRICENFPYFVYSDVHLNVMHARLHTHTVCIFLLFFAMYFWGSE